MKRGSIRYSSKDPEATIVELHPGSDDCLVRKIPGVRSGPRRKVIMRMLQKDNCVFR